MITKQELLEQAAKNIETFGWVQGEYGDPECGVCATAAILLAAGFTFETLCESRIKRVAFTPDNEYRTMVSEIFMWFREQYPMSLAGWNDHPQRTQAEVVARLRWMASQLA